MKYLSLFSGIGGFELGIQQAYEQSKSNRTLGDRKLSTETTDLRQELHFSDSTSKLGNGWGECPQCIGFSEIDKYAIQTYQKHYPEHKNYGDITKINADELPDFDLLVGGFPCQSFSIAGKRLGFEDTRGTLFFEIARVLKEKQPRLFLLENVKGLLSHDNGQTFRTIIATLDELGYDLQWQVLNSKNHGVPQNRERIFIVGHIRGTSRPEVFPFAGEHQETKPRQTEVPNKIISNCISTHEGIKSRAENGATFIQQLNQPKHSNNRVFGTGGLSPTLNTMQGGNRQPFVALEDIKIRRLTPTECERLQGFPDGWTIGSDTQRYKQCGNAVTVNVIKDIMERLL